MTLLHHQAADSAQGKVHVVFVNFNTSESLIRCIESIPTAQLASCQIVDNCSSSADKRTLAEYIKTHPSVQCHYSDTNLGFGAAINLAVRLLNAPHEEYLWILNPDMIVHLDTIPKLVGALSDTQFSIASPVITTGNEGEEIWYAGGEVDMRAGSTKHFHTMPVCSDEIKRVPVTFMTGAAPVMKASTWMAVGGFREDLFMYWEDADLSIRANKQQMKMCVVPDATVWHEVGGSTIGVGKSELWHYYMQRNRLIVLGTYMPKWRLLFGHGMRQAVRLFRAAGKERERPTAKMLASLRGVVAGCLGVGTRAYVR